MGRTLQELTIADNFMFGAVMTISDNCRRMLELSLDICVGSVEVNTEKSFFYHPEYKGVRLDVYAKDDNNTHYDVEMQVAKKEALAKRTRYYHSQMDMELLGKGMDFNDNYVRQLQESVKKVKKSREMGVRYMQLQELLKEERAEGRREELANQKYPTEGVYSSVGVSKYQINADSGKIHRKSRGILYLTGKKNLSSYDFWQIGDETEKQHLVTAEV